MQRGLICVVAAGRRNLNFRGMLAALKVGREIRAIDARREILDMCHDYKVQSVAHPVQQHLAVNQQFIMILNVSKKRWVA